MGSLFAAFLGYNPIQELLGRSGVLGRLSPAQASKLTGTTFFPQLIFRLEREIASGRSEAA